MSSRPCSGAHEVGVIGRQPYQRSTITPLAMLTHCQRTLRALKSCECDLVMSDVRLSLFGIGLCGEDT